MAKYNELNLGQIEAIANKLGGTEGVQEFLSGKTEVRKASPFKVWKTITTSIWNDFEELCNEAFKFNFDLQYRAINAIKNAVKHLPVPIISEKFDFVIVTSNELGIKDAVATYENVCQTAIEQGLQLCPPHAVIEFYFKKWDCHYNAFNKLLMIGMTPIVIEKTPTYFTIRNTVVDRALFEGHSYSPGFSRDGHYLFSLHK